jgi:hypothetical protein
MEHSLLARRLFFALDIAIPWQRIQLSRAILEPDSGLSSVAWRIAPLTRNVDFRILNIRPPDGGLHDIAH